MIRPLAALALLVTLGSCGFGGGEQHRAPSAVQMGNPADSRVAKHLFGAASRPSGGEAQSIGAYAAGCQAGAVALPETGPTWQAMRLSRNRNWGQPELVDFLQDLSQTAATLPGWNGLYVGDMSQPRGGPMSSGHASHQTGIDADIWMLPATRLDLSRAERESLSSIAMDRRNGAYINDSWSPQHEALLRAAASDPRVARIFIFPAAKVAMCDSATGDRSWLRKIRPWAGHNTHFHVRLNCPAGDTSCQAQDPIPAGDGCAEAREWVANLISPPPPNPNAPPPAPPRGDLTMAQLPAQCHTVLSSN